MSFFPLSIMKCIPKWIYGYSIKKSEIVLWVYPQYNVAVSVFLKNHINTQYKQLMDITAVDYPSQNLRFTLVYNFLSIVYNSRIRLKTSVTEIESVGSVTEVFPCAAWSEREVWDMFGIFFYRHPDLRRILTDYGFKGHPLRKDFPLSGYVEVRYDDSEKRVITEPLELSQEFRYFDFDSPWDTLEKTQ